MHTKVYIYIQTDKLTNMFIYIYIYIYIYAGPLLADERVGTGLFPLSW